MSSLNITKSTGTAIVLCPYLKIAEKFEEQLQEAVRLAEAIQLNIKEARLLKQRIFHPATFISKGHVDELEGLIQALEITVVIIDAAISPIQQRNLEKRWKVKVIDRTGLILEIFGSRARTAEGRLQVELAALTYQRSRLVRTWTHLERQRGGFGFIGGPGESQLEMDRRMIDDKILKIKKQLNEVKRTRNLQRSARKRAAYPVIALVGYTNAGKSTLFNKLTQAKVLAKDMLFATLDPTMRRITLPSKRQIILTDTVGFISELPTLLIAAFQATLEEILEADLILHVRDISHPQSEQQAVDVNHVLLQLGFEEDYEDKILEVWNKSDLLDNKEISFYQEKSNRAKGAHPILVSALNGKGCDSLLKAIELFFSTQEQELKIAVPLIEGKKLAKIYAESHVIERYDDEDMAYFRVRIAKDALSKLKL